MMHPSMVLLVRKAAELATLPGLWATATSRSTSAGIDRNHGPWHGRIRVSGEVPLDLGPGRLTEDLPPPVQALLFRNRTKTGRTTLAVAKRIATGPTRMTCRLRNAYLALYRHKRHSAAAKREKASGANVLPSTWQAWVQLSAERRIG